MDYGLWDRGLWTVDCGLLQLKIENKKSKIPYANCKIH